MVFQGITTDACALVQKDCSGRFFAQLLGGPT